VLLAVDVVLPVVSRVEAGVAAEEALVGHEAVSVVVVSAVAAEAHLGVEGVEVVSRGAAEVAAVSVAVVAAAAGSKRLHLLQGLPLSDTNAGSVSLRKSRLRRGRTSLRFERSHNVRFGFVLGTWTGCTGVLEGLWDFVAIFHGRIRTIPACVHMKMQQVRIVDVFWSSVLCYSSSLLQANPTPCRHRANRHPITSFFFIA
jgi:hypothetical protein